MENVIEWLREARGEIIAGLVLALLGWLYSRYRSFMKMYRLKKKELERMENDMFRFGNTKKEIESLQEALKESEAQRQDVKNQLETLQQELRRKDEALRESEAKSHEASQRIEELQSQLETSQAEIQRKNETATTAEPTKIAHDFLEKLAQIIAPAMITFGPGKIYTCQLNEFGEFGSIIDPYNQIISNIRRVVDLYVYYLKYIEKVSVYEVNNAMKIGFSIITSVIVMDALSKGNKLSKEQEVTIDEIARKIGSQVSLQTNNSNATVTLSQSEAKFLTDAVKVVSTTLRNC